MSAVATVAVIAEAIRIAAPVITQIVECLSGEREEMSLDEPTRSAVALALFEARRARYLAGKGGG